MLPFRVLMLRAGAAAARRRSASLAGLLIKVKPAEREATLAALEFERWLADSCRSVLANR